MTETALQQYLRAGNSPESLTKDLGINVYKHPSLPLLGFKYDQIESPKTNPIVLASRGTVLEAESYNLVAQPFFRFFNLGEADNLKTFDWNSCVGATKEDGSLSILYNYKDTWHMNTSGSFGLGLCGFSGKSWRDVFWEVSGLKERTHLLDPRNTYIFELCSVHNKIVRLYNPAKVSLLGVMRNTDLHDFPFSDIKDIANSIGTPHPDLYSLSSLEAVQELLATMEAKDKTWEGLVLRDATNTRIKIKTQTYLSLHRLKDNGNIANPKYLVPLVLDGELDEIITYFPELEQQLKDTQSRLAEEFNTLEVVYDEHKYIESQKDFALAILPKTKFTGILFTARKTGEPLKSLWRQNHELIVKVLYGN